MRLSIPVILSLITLGCGAGEQDPPASDAGTSVADPHR